VGGLLFRADFDSGNLGGVSVDEDGYFVVSIAPDGQGAWAACTGEFYAPCALVFVCRKCMCLAGMVCVDRLGVCGGGLIRDPCVMGCCVTKASTCLMAHSLLPPPSPHTHTLVAPNKLHPVHDHAGSTFLVPPLGPWVAGTVHENRYRLWWFFAVCGGHPGRTIRVRIIDMNEIAKAYNIVRERSAVSMSDCGHG
jgi:hypothetical protein